MPSLADVGDQVHDLGLHRHVERRGRFVGDQQVRLQGHGHGNHHALAHAARKLVRKVLHPVAGRRDADTLQQRRRPLESLAATAFTMSSEGLGNLPADG